MKSNRSFHPVKSGQTGRVSDLSAKMMFLGYHQFINDLIDLFVGKCFLIVLQREADSIRFFTGSQLFTFVNVE